MSNTPPDVEERYFDGDGNPCTLDKLCRTEPEWAANVIRWLKRRAAELEREKAAALERIGYAFEEVEARRSQLQRRGGQTVGAFGDFANVPPSALGRLEWHLRAIRAALEPGGKS